MKSNYRILLGVVVSALALAAVLLTVDFRALRDALAATPLRAVGWAALWFVLAMLARAWAWRALLGPQVPLSTAFWALQVGFLLNNVLPLRLGELARAWVVHREAGVSWPRALSSVALARLVDAALLAAVVVLAWPAQAPLPREWVWKAVGLIAAAGLGLALLVALARGPWLRALPHRVGDALADAVAVAQGPGWLPFLLGKVVTWALLAAYFHVLAAAWAPRLTFVEALWGMAASTLGIAVPSAPGYVGVYEAAAVGVLTLLRVPAESALAFALVQHGLYLWLTTLLGLLALARLGWDKKRWRAELNTAQKAASSSRRDAR